MMTRKERPESMVPMAGVLRCSSGPDVIDKEADMYSQIPRLLVF